MGQRSRKRGRREKTPARAPVTSRPRITAEERNAAVRATLTPLAPGERPWPLLVAVVLAAISGGAQLALFLFGVKLKVAGTHAQAGPTIVFGMLMFACAAGMWALRYWALLGFMSLLGILIVYFSFALLKVSSLLGLVIALGGVATGGYLFWKLIRVLSRIQMPRYPGR